MFRAVLNLCPKFFSHTEPCSPHNILVDSPPPLEYIVFSLISDCNTDCNIDRTHRNTDRNTNHNTDHNTATIAATCIVACAWNRATRTLLNAFYLAGPITSTRLLLQMLTIYLNWLSQHNPAVSSSTDVYEELSIAIILECTMKTIFII